MDRAPRRFVEPYIIMKVFSQDRAQQRFVEHNIIMTVYSQDRVHRRLVKVLKIFLQDTVQRRLREVLKNFVQDRVRQLVVEMVALLHHAGCDSPTEQPVGRRRTPCGSSGWLDAQVMGGWSRMTPTLRVLEQCC